MSPALAGRFSTTGLPGKYPLFAFEWIDTDIDGTQQYTYNVLPHGFQDSPHLPGKALELREPKLDTGPLSPYVYNLFICSPSKKASD